MSSSQHQECYTQSIRSGLDVGGFGLFTFHFVFFPFVSHADSLWKDKYGVTDLRTLDTFFQLFDLWIMLYRLLVSYSLKLEELFNSVSDRNVPQKTKENSEGECTGWNFQQGVEIQRVHVSI